MTFFEARFVKVTQERDATVAKAEQLALRAQFVSGLVEDAMTFLKRVSSFETAAHQLLKRLPSFGKLLAKRSNRKIADVEAELEKACVESDARSADVAESKARVIEPEKQEVQGASQARVAESKYSLLYDEAGTLNQ